MLKLYLFFNLILFSIQISFAQKNEKVIHDLGIYTTFSKVKNENLLITPQTWLYFKDMYIEARYNYEEKNTFSVYFGYTYFIRNKMTFEITPILGLVMGKIHGISPGYNFNFYNEKLSSSTQCQYTFEINKKENSFFWNWSNLSFNLTNNFALGGAVQILYSKNKDSNFYNVSPLIGFSTNDFKIECYLYNFWKQNRIWSLAFEYDF